MATGKIDSYDPDKREGYIIPDTPHGEDDKIPFDEDALKTHDVRTLKVGDSVSYDVEGGLAGVMAKDVRRISAGD